ncbi:hypothetical protein C0995_005850 [Termitomyces sp. Mi166|nr:hypothetical protein C0995_005850 [Termitomyces sp. Mi166\
MSALTFHVLGLRVTSPQGKTWSLSLHLGESLSGAEGRFETPLGSFGVRWTLSAGTSSSGADLQQRQVPGGMGGTLEIEGVEMGGVAD